MKEYMKEIHSLEEFEAAAQDKLSVFVFSANWCPVILSHPLCQS